MSDSTPSFAADIKPLFRESDREAMRVAFDLWSFDDVSLHAGPILRADKCGIHAVRRALAGRQGRASQALDRCRKAGVVGHHAHAIVFARLVKSPRQYMTCHVS